MIVRNERRSCPGFVLPWLLVLGTWTGAPGAGEEPGDAAGDLSFTRIVVDEEPPSRPWYKMLGDLDGDGLLDIVVAGANGPLVWYRNPDWSKGEIAKEGWNGVNGEIADIDRDGDADIVLGGVVWIRNPRVGGGIWAMIRIDTAPAHDIELGDLDRDGRLDIVARDQSAFGGKGNTISVYRQKTPTSWEKSALSCPHGEGLKLADLDEDGDDDIAIAERWYENTGRPKTWREHRYTDGWGEPDAKVEVADLNGDGRPDIVLTPAELRGERHRVAWYEAPSDPRAPGWKEHVIVPDVESVVHSLAVGDLDGDGDVDVAIAEMHQGADPDEVSVYLNDEAGRKWTKLLLSTDGSHDLVAGDIDADGDLDLVGANHAGPHQAVELWRNELRRRP